MGATGAAPLSYQWQKLNGGTWTNIPGATGSTHVIFNAVEGDEGQYRAVVTNSAGSATSNAATLTVNGGPGNGSPTASITAPATYTFGQTIAFSGTASDPEDGTLPASRFTWRVEFGHDTHFHPHVAPFSGTTSGSFVANFNETAPNQFYRIILTVTDSAGAQATVTRDVQPVRVSLTLQSSPAGVTLSIDGQPVSGPVQSVVGMQRLIQAPATATISGTAYQFSSWSDGGAASHSITTPASNATYTATYQPSGGGGGPRVPGIKAEFFDFTTALSAMPNLTGLTPTVTRTDNGVYYGNSAAPWSGLDSRFQDTFALRDTGYLRITTAGSYTIHMNSDDGSRLWVDGTLLIDNDGLHGLQQRSGTRTLSAGDHALRIEYFENNGGAGLMLWWSGPGIPMQVVPSSAFVRDPS